LSDNEKTALVKASTLTPFVVKQVIVLGESCTKAARPFLVLCLHLIVLANSASKTIGKCKLCMPIMPAVSTGSWYSLFLGPQQVVEVFGSRLPGGFDLKRPDRPIFTQACQAMSSLKDREAMFKSLFDIPRVMAHAKKSDYVVWPR